MNYRPVTHVFEPSLLCFPMNRLAVEGDPSGDVYCVAQLFLFCWFVRGVVVFELDFCCMYMITNYELKLFNWWKLH